MIWGLKAYRMLEDTVPARALGISLGRLCKTKNKKEVKQFKFIRV